MEFICNGDGMVIFLLSTSNHSSRSTTIHSDITSCQPFGDHLGAKWNSALMSSASFKPPKNPESSLSRWGKWGSGSDLEVTTAGLWFKPRLVQKPSLWTLDTQIRIIKKAAKSSWKTCTLSEFHLLHQHLEAPHPHPGISLDP